MKLQKIKHIKQYKSFQDFSWQEFFNGEIFHESVNILFGENGTGKSSFSNILKSVSNKKPFALGKLGHIPEKICLEFDDGEYNYSSSEWDNTKKQNNILFFDREFIGENVHLGHTRDTTQNGQEQQSGKLIIEVDNEAIQLRNARDKAKIESDEQNKKVKNFNKLHENTLNFSLSDDEMKIYNSYKDKTDEKINTIKEGLDEERDNIKNNIKTYRELKSNTSKINDIKLLLEEGICLSLFLSDYESFQAIFNFDLKEKTEIETEQKLIDKIKAYNLFFEKGFEIRKKHERQCPFCQSTNEEQSIKKIINLHEEIYDATYDEQLKLFKTNKQVLLDEIKKIIETISDYNRTAIFLKLKELQENYKIPKIYLLKEEEEENKKPEITAIDELKNKLKDLTKPDKENVLDLYNRAKSEYEKIKTFFQTIKNFIEEKNNVITHFKSKNTDEKLQEQIDKSSTRLSQIENELKFINENKINKQKDKEAKKKEKVDLSNDAENSKRVLTIAKESYEGYCSGGIFPNLLSQIEIYFNNFNFKFTLHQKRTWTGNKTEFPFAFEILDDKRRVRDFNEGLSEGEMQVLSLCFFFAFLDLQGEKNQKIIIFDDPITSLDNSNLSYLVDLIAEKQEEFSQVFILSHHRTFFKFLQKKFTRKFTRKYKEYNFIRNQKELGGSFICKNESKKFSAKLKNFEEHLRNIPPNALDQALKVVEYGQYLRYEVERYIKNDLLQWNANDFTTAVDGVKENKKIDNDDLDKIKKIYSFCNWTTAHVDIGDDYGLNQLKEKISDFVKIIEKSSTPESPPSDNPPASESQDNPPASENQGSSSLLPPPS